MSVWSGSRFLLKNHLLASVYNSTQSHTKKKNKLTCLHPTGLWAFGPTHETKERTRNSDKVIQDVVYRASPKSEAEGPGVTSHPTGRLQAGGSRGLSYKGEKEVTIYRGSWCQTGSPVTRRTSRGASLCQPLRLTVAKGPRRAPLIASLGGWFCPQH